jgi:hypothetical protein
MEKQEELDYAMAWFRERPACPSAVSSVLAFTKLPLVQPYHTSGYHPGTTTSTGHWSIDSLGPSPATVSKVRIDDVHTLLAGLQEEDADDEESAIITKTFTEANSLQGTQTATPLLSLHVVKTLHVCIGNA